MKCPFLYESSAHMHWHGNCKCICASRCFVRAFTFIDATVRQAMTDSNTYQPTKPHPVTAREGCLQVTRQVGSEASENTVNPPAIHTTAQRREGPNGSEPAICTPSRHVDFGGQLATRTARLSARLAGTCSFASALSGMIDMSKPRTGSRNLNLGLCLMATAVISACGGANGDPTTSDIALSASAGGMASMASAQGLTSTVAPMIAPGAAADTASNSGSQNVGTAEALPSGVLTGSSPAPAPTAYAPLPPTSAGPLSTGGNVAPSPSTMVKATAVLS